MPRFIPANIMVVHPEDNIHLLFNTFQQLDYWNKLTCFDSHFGLIPFPFPVMDAKLSWFADDDKLCLLVDNFYKEIRSRSMQEKVFEKDDAIIKFDVRPTSVIQRTLYNNFVLSKFLIAEETVRKSIEADLERMDEPDMFLKAKIHSVHDTILWIKNILHNKKAKFALRHQFLKVVYSGLKNYQTGDGFNTRSRRKFVEAYLYSQGVFIASYLHWLQYLLEKSELNILDRS